MSNIARFITKIIQGEDKPLMKIVMAIDRQTCNKPCSNMKPIIIGTAVKTPIWIKNWAFNAASSAVFPSNLAWCDIAESSPDSAWIFEIKHQKGIYIWSTSAIGKNQQHQIICMLVKNLGMQDINLFSFSTSCDCSEKKKCLCELTR